MNLGFWRTVSLVVALMLAGAANAETLSKMERNYARFERFAGAPVEQVRNFQLQRWQPLGKYSLAVWIHVNTVYLIDVDQHCYGLDFAHAIGFTTSVSTLYRRFDSVVFDKQTCRIERIRPVDYKAYRAAWREEREQEKREKGNG